MHATNILSIRPEGIISMSLLKKNISTSSLAVLLFMLFACAPEIDSGEWCVNIKKCKVDWTACKATYFAKHYILK